jgi:hypothetical protein
MATAVEPVIKGGISWEEFVASPEYKRLTPPQKVWVVCFFASGDPFFAARLAFNCSSEINVRNMARQTERSPRIVAALNLYRGKTEREIFLQELEKTIRASEDGSVAKVRAMSLYARLKFDVQTPDEPAESGKCSPAKAGRFKVGDPVLINGEKRKVLAVDANGEPIEVSDEVIQ